MSSYNLSTIMEKAFRRRDLIENHDNTKDPEVVTPIKSSDEPKEKTETILPKDKVEVEDSKK